MKKWWMIISIFIVCLMIGVVGLSLSYNSDSKILDYIHYHCNHYEIGYILKNILVNTIYQGNKGYLCREKIGDDINWGAPRGGIQVGQGVGAFVGVSGQSWVGTGIDINWGVLQSGEN